jgi:predicted metallo-beta-lactamase superfamily hydrolase
LGIFRYVYHSDNLVELDNIEYQPVKSSKILLISDVQSRDYNEPLNAVYNNSTQLMMIKGPIYNLDFSKYPYTSMDSTFERLYDTEVRIAKNR